MRRHLSSTNRTERGVAYIELALVLPLTLFIICAGLEFANELRVQEILTNISREGASEVYRNCARLSSTTIQKLLCLQQKAMNSSFYAHEVMPNVTVVTSVFSNFPSFEENKIRFARCETGAPGCVSNWLKETNTAVTYPDETRFAEANLTGGGEYASLMSNHRELGISEISGIYKPLFPFIARILFGANKEIYHATVY